jgi:hypothetical protein
VDGAWWRAAAQRAGLGVVVAAGAVLVPAGLGLLLDVTLGFQGRVAQAQSPALAPLAPLHWVVGVAALKAALRLLAPRLQHLGPDPMHTLAVVARGLLRWPGGPEPVDLATAEVARVAAALLRAVGAGVCVPYALVVGALPAAGLDGEDCVTAWRALYPAAMGHVVMVAGGWRAVRGVARMHDAIRDSIYLVGRRLHNID